MLAMTTMKLVKKVREATGLNPWALHKRMGFKRVQSYLALERTSKRIALKDLFSLEKIWVEENCGTREDFWSLARECAAEKVKKSKSE